MYSDNTENIRFYLFNQPKTQSVKIVQAHKYLQAEKHFVLTQESDLKC